MRTGKVKGKRSRRLCAQGWDGSALGSGPDVGRSGGVTRVSSDAVGNGYTQATVEGFLFSACINIYIVTM